MASILDIAASPVFSGLTGGLLSIATGVVNFFQRRDDRKHELLMVEKDMEMKKLMSNLEEARFAGMMALSREQGAAAAFTASVESEGKIKGEHKIITSLRASVRPVMVYVYQFAFFSVLGFACLAWVNKWAGDSDLVPLVQFMVVSIINTATMTVSWYFGQRAFDKVAVKWGNQYSGASVNPASK